MPIMKIPITHKFGIISSSHRIALQERLHKQVHFISNRRKEPSINHRDPIEATELFVQQFNTADCYESKEKYEEKARKLLERAKRRSGLKNCGYGNHVNLPLAWTEMAQLVQCKGRIQEECLDILVTSLDVSPLERYHIPALFFLAETMLYWLRTEEVLHPFIRTVEIKLLKMGQLVFERLFYHHMTGQLHEVLDCKKRLCTYIDGLEQLQEVYDNFPNALLYVRFVIEVGKIILTDFQFEHGDANSNNLLQVPGQKEEEPNLDAKDVYEYYIHDDVRSTHSRAISSCVHDLSPTLWHALDVFRCTNSLSGGLQDALKALEHCGFGLSSETWIDGIVAIQVLGESAKTDLAAMKVLHHLAQGVRAADDVLTHLPLSSGSSRAVPQASLSSEAASSEESQDEDDTRQMTDTNDTTEIVNSDSTPTRKQVPYPPGITGWHWEVALTYIEVLESIVLYGRTAAIQKYALVGSSSDMENLLQHGHNTVSSAGLLDLVFLKPRHDVSIEKVDTQDWSWRIRFGAMQSLVKICRSLKGDKTREGLRTTAWKTLLKANAKEKDWRVLEALKVAQIHIDCSSYLDPSIQELPVSLGKHIATELSAVYLPPIPPPSVASARIRMSPRPHHVIHTPVVIKQAETKPLRTSLKQEIKLATALNQQTPDYNTRKSSDLRRIVEDQWRKELQATLEEDEKIELKAMKDKQQTEEERQRQVAESKQKKFQKKILPEGKVL